jgi:hydrogenase expression/formation protein HypD
MVIGTDPYQFISQQYHKPIVVSGFEPFRYFSINLDAIAAAS